jgi:hypothetical protein
MGHLSPLFLVEIDAFSAEFRSCSLSATVSDESGAIANGCQVLFLVRSPTTGLELFRHAGTCIELGGPSSPPDRPPPPQAQSCFSRASWLFGRVFSRLWQIHSRQTSCVKALYLPKCDSLLPKIFNAGSPPSRTPDDSSTARFLVDRAHPWSEAQRRMRDLPLRLNRSETSIQDPISA